MKQQMYQEFVLKIESSRILKAPNRNLKITIPEARRNGEIISLADSTVLRMIDEINGFDRNTAVVQITQTRREIRALKKEKNIIGNRRKIKALYAALDEIQCKWDYVSIIMSKPSDFDRLLKGFKINDIEYKRLIGTTNGVKKDTVVFAPVINKLGKPMHAELCRRLENGRNPDKELIPAKYEAYKALACSASIPVSSPQGILVVDDLVVHFNDDIIIINDERTAEPEISYENAEVELNANDGFGLMSPKLAERWSEDMKISYLMGAACLRNSFCKGIVVTFDFQEFNRRFADTAMVQDVWGEAHDINDIELILTTSMLKLWDSYSSIGHYLACCVENGYTFSLTKVCPQTLENERTLNYQFIQSYKLSDEDIHELIEPTVSEIKSVLHDNVDKTILYMKGGITSLKEIDNTPHPLKALMIDPRLIDDPYIINYINYFIKKKIDTAKIGVLKIHGNYAIIIGDPYALCQHIFKTNVDAEGNNKLDELGLLKAGEMYSKYWSDLSVPEIVCFRAPMSAANNIRLANVVTNDEMAYWYQYLPAINITNCHDTLCHAENGCDFDGDCLITTDNPVLLRNTKRLPAIVCVQRKATKSKITEDLLVKANKNSFGDSIGSTTNKITSMYEVQAKFPPESKEYKTLEYRIMCGQLYQQNCIDKTKGIIAKPMPKTWYDKHAVIKNLPPDTEIDEDFDYGIVANRKPYFMNYIYPQQRSDYQKFIKTAEMKCYCEFSKTIKQLKAQETFTEGETHFLKWLDISMPVGMNPCTMNKIAWTVEKEFEGYTSLLRGKSSFDYRILKSGVKYSPSTYKDILELHTQYNSSLQQIIYKTRLRKYDKEAEAEKKISLRNDFMLRCYNICQNEEELCDILLDMCYRTEKSKKFVWEMCGDVIINNLLKKNGNKISYLIKDPEGEITYRGNRYSKHIYEVEETA